MAERSAWHWVVQQAPGEHSVAEAQSEHRGLIRARGAEASVSGESGHLERQRQRASPGSEQTLTGREQRRESEAAADDSVAERSKVQDAPEAEASAGLGAPEVPDSAWSEMAATAAVDRSAVTLCQRRRAAR